MPLKKFEKRSAITNDIKTTTRKVKEQPSIFGVTCVKYEGINTYKKFGSVIQKFTRIEFIDDKGNKFASMVSANTGITEKQSAPEIIIDRDRDIKLQNSNGQEDTVNCLEHLIAQGVEMIGYRGDKEIRICIDNQPKITAYNNFDKAVKNYNLLMNPV